MWFKNLSIFRLATNWNMTAGKLTEHLSQFQFTRCASSDINSSGWVQSSYSGDLVHSANQQWLLKYRIEKKLLPTSVINQVVKDRAAELEENQGFAPGRKALKDLKERVTDELIPRAFTTHTDTQVWIDPKNGWLIIDSPSSTRVDSIIKALLKAVPILPIESLRVKNSPKQAMTDWLASNEAPSGFTIDQDTELKSTSEDKATVRYVHHTLEVDDIQKHIGAGKQCTKLAMTWNDRISFVLTDNLTIKRIKPLDILDEEKDKGTNEEERFDADFILMAGELGKMLDDVAGAIGGEENSQKDLVQGSQSTSDDDLYEQAKKIVLGSGTASISRVQRVLQIGYNRAARLLEMMEENKIISPPNPAGVREVLP